MSVAITGTGGFFSRRGKELGEINRIVSSCFGTPLENAVSGVFAEYVSNETAHVSGLFAARDQVRASAQPYVSTLQSQAIAASVAQVDRDSALLPYTLDNALRKLIAQMRADGDSIQRAVTAATVTAAAANEGDAVVHLHLSDAYGLPMDMVFGETLTATVTADPGNGGATKYREPIVVVGAATRPYLDYRWPAGSGGAVALAVADAADTATNELANGDFATWAGTGNNTPGSWSALAGAFNSQIIRGSTAPVLRSGDGAAYHLRFDSDGSTLAAVGQAVSLDPLTVYCLNLWARVDATDGTGTLVVKLIDADGATIADDAGTALSYSRDMSSQIGTAWTNVKVFWATPRLIPSARLSVGFGASPAAARNVDVALVTLAAATRLYPGGPYCAAFSKEAQSAKDDTYALAVTNNLTRWCFARALDGLFGLRDKGLALPSALTPTVSDGLIVAAT